MKFKLLLLSLISFCFTSTYSIGQDPLESKEYILKISNYRDYLLRNNEEALYELKHLLEKWDSVGCPEKDKIDFTYNVLKYRLIDKYSFGYIKKRGQKFMPNSLITTKFTEIDLNTIERNSELLDLIFLGVLESKYPFKIDPDLEFYKELKTYNIRKNEKIAEIGAGNGMFSLVLKLMNPTIEIYVNELDSEMIDYLSVKMEKFNKYLALEGFFVVKGSKKSTELADFGIQKIIVRNSFHHFKKKELMLASMLKSLTEGGELFLMESTKDKNFTEDGCEFIMSKEEIINVVTQVGFQVQNEVDLLENTVFEFDKTK